MKNSISTQIRNLNLSMDTIYRKEREHARRLKKEDERFEVILAITTFLLIGTLVAGIAYFS